MSANHNNDHHQHGKDHHHEHHILSTPMALKVWGTLMVLTFITVAVAQVDLGFLNFTVALLVATVKATIVCMFFMGLKYDHKENTVIFSTSIIFLAIFMILTFGDLVTRGDVYVKDGKIVPDTFTAGAPVKSKFDKPWVSSPELIAHGKQQFQAQCVTCHGAEGKGNGVAAAGLNPKPRNFSVGEGWKNGRKASQVFATLTNPKGLNGMPAFGSSPSDDRWGLAHYVRSLGPHENEKDSSADLLKVGIDPEKGDTGGGAEKAIPVDLAIDQIVSGAPDVAAAKPAKKSKVR
jgi:caa(3)-type oxidase subunit IV